MIPGLSLIGAGMDSCVINSSQVNPPVTYSIRVTDSCYLAGFKIMPYIDDTQGHGIYIYDVNIENIYAVVEKNKIINAKYGIDISSSSLGTDYIFKLIRMNVVLNVGQGIICDQTAPIIQGNIVYAKSNGLMSGIISAPTYLDNIVVFENAPNGLSGFGGGFDLISVVKNNLFISLDGSGESGIASYTDSLNNNIVSGAWNYGIFTAGSPILDAVIKNNHIEGTQKALVYDESAGGIPPIFQYNNLWQNQINYQDFTGDSTNLYSDPMFVNEDSMDFHLQMYSPLIDAGDPNILDKDGSRSDIGLYGGPYGEKYTYRDLAPKPPSNLTAVMDSGLVKLIWNKNTESDFYRYRVYRDTVPDFMYDTTKIIAVIPDTIYYDDPPQKYISGNYYYKITALDKTQHQSAPSEEVHVNITGIPEGPPIVIDHYRLLNNYPNPFNSSTIIPYRLSEGGYVKLYIYDAKGELVRVLVNGYQSAGYYEVRFSPTKNERSQGKFGEEYWTGYNDDIASGIYIYQLMVRGDGDIPVFTGMGKMILLK
jgi:hypothetical protein